MKLAVLGSPVAHSKSPAMHAAAYRALGLPHTYDAIDCDRAGLERLVAELRRGEWGGFNVTVPHKLAALALADDVDASARLARAANTLARSAAGKVVAYNTDVGALVGELRALAGDAIAGKTGVVVGTGGAARAAVAAFGRLGARRVVIVGRHADAFAAEAERILHEASSEPTSLATTSILPRSLSAGPFAVAEAAAVVQTTTCGMTGGPDGAIVATAVDWAALSPDAVALDVVYAPEETPFLAAAKAAHLRAAGGLGMLARQGGLAFEIWLGVAPPLDVMLRAIGG